MTADALVIGGGLFGCHAALFLAERGKRVVVVERDDDLITRASIVNQARLHAGYHYPRSIATARTSDANIDRFRREFADCINDDFVHYYAIARRGSLTDADQFRHFCAYLDLPCEPVPNHPAFRYDQLEAVFATREDSFDPHLLAERYRERVRATPGITVLTRSEVVAAVRKGAHRSSFGLQSTEISKGSKPDIDAPAGPIAKPETFLESEASHPDRRGRKNSLLPTKVGYFEVKIMREDREVHTLETPLVVNATYASVNSLHRRFGYPDIPLQHEIAEMAFVRTTPSFTAAALTVMDGPFCSLMPYGKTGLHSLSSVAYTHQRVSYGPEPAFSCQDDFPSCAPSSTADCSRCSRRPTTNYPKMLAQLRRYLTPAVGLNYKHSRFTIKAKLQANHIDDGRPTAVRLLDDDPAFVTLFAGKVNSVYAVEKILGDV